MTGLLGRLRAWLGSLFGRGEDDEEADDEASGLQGGGPEVTHRDDRPLETPNEALDPDMIAEAESGDDEAAAAEDGNPYVEPDVEFEVSIADAEEGEEVSEGDDLACAVCGTGVDDPESACPLCGSTELRHA